MTDEQTNKNFFPFGNGQPIRQNLCNPNDWKFKEELSNNSFKRKNVFMKINDLNRTTNWLLLVYSQGDWIKTQDVWNKNEMKHIWLIKWIDLVLILLLINKGQIISRTLRFLHPFFQDKLFLEYWASLHPFFSFW